MTDNYSNIKPEFQRLYRDSAHNVFAGVCAGLANYFKVDVVLIRILFVLSAFWGLGLLAYIILWVIMPKQQLLATEIKKNFETNPLVYQWVGGAMIFLGLLLFLDNFNLNLFSHFYDFLADFGFPIALIMVGSLMIYLRFRSPELIKQTERVDDMNTQEPKRLTRVMKEKMIGGVCSGLGYYFNIDPVIIRALAIVAFFASYGIAVLVYIVMMIITPKENN